jgi:hypothetical protein
LNRYPYADGNPVSGRDTEGDIGPIALALITAAIVEAALDAAMTVYEGYINAKDAYESNYDPSDDSAAKEAAREQIAEDAKTAVVGTAIGVVGGAIAGPVGRKVGSKVARKVAGKAYGEATRKLGKKARRIAKAAEEAYPKKAGKVERHHMRPRYLRGSKHGTTRDLPDPLHQVATNRIREQFPYGRSGRPSGKEIEETLEDIYEELGIE